jgi:hypothetical protein
LITTDKFHDNVSFALVGSRLIVDIVCNTGGVRRFRARASAPLIGMALMRIDVDDIDRRVKRGRRSGSVVTEDRLLIQVKTRSF